MGISNRYCELIMNVKICKICNIERDINDFYIKNKDYGTRQTKCKFCICEENKLKRTSERKPTMKDAGLHRCSMCKEIKPTIEFYSNSHRCKLCDKEYHKQEYVQQRKRKFTKRWDDNNRSHKAKYMNNRYHSNIQVKLSMCISSSINYSLQHNKHGNHWEELVGYTISDLICHLQSLFQPGMTWDNYGEWQIDHKFPITSFNITDYICEDFKRCWALSNLQPMWAEENRKKQNKIIY